jgi:hypothetical protein
MSVALYNRMALSNMRDYITPTSARNYDLGAILEIEDSSTQTVQKYMYVKSHTALIQYQPYVVSISGTTGSEVITAAPATLAAPGSLIGIPQVAFTSGYYGFVLIQGTGKVLMIAETYAVGDMLQILNTGTALVVDGTTGSTTFSVNTSAVCKEAGTTAVARAVNILGRPAVVAAT